MKAVILQSDGLYYCAEYPEDPTEKKWENSQAFHEAISDYEQQIKQALENAVKFKDKEDEAKIRIALRTEHGKMGECPDADCELTGCKNWNNCRAIKWQMEQHKPYGLSEGIEIVLLDEYGNNVPHAPQFAFIKREPKVESQNEHWDKMAAWLHSKGIFFAENRISHHWIIMDHLHGTPCDKWANDLTDNPYHAQRFETRFEGINFLIRYNLKSAEWEITEHQFIDNPSSK